MNRITLVLVFLVVCVYLTNAGIVDRPDIVLAKRSLVAGGCKIACDVCYMVSATCECELVPECLDDLGLHVDPMPFIDEEVN